MWITLVSIALAGEAREPVPEGALALVPFGVPQMMWGQPGRGVAYALTQAAGVGVAIGAAVAYDELTQDDVEDEAEEPLNATVFVGVAVAATAYAVQLVDGSRLAEERAAARARAQAARAAVARFDVGRQRAAEAR